jgi:hypothetical protein
MSIIDQDSSNYSLEECYICSTASNIGIRPCECKPYLCLLCHVTWLSDKSKLEQEKPKCEICKSSYNTIWDEWEKVNEEIVVTKFSCMQCIKYNYSIFIAPWIIYAIFLMITIICIVSIIILFHGYTYLDMGYKNHQISIYNNELHEFYKYECMANNQTLVMTNCNDYDDMDYIEDKCGEQCANIYLIDKSNKCGKQCDTIYRIDKCMYEDGSYVKWDLDNTLGEEKKKETHRDCENFCDGQWLKSGQVDECVNQVTDEINEIIVVKYKQHLGKAEYDNRNHEIDTYPWFIFGLVVSHLIISVGLTGLLVLAFYHDRWIYYCCKMQVQEHYIIKFANMLLFSVLVSGLIIISHIIGILIQNEDEFTFYPTIITAMIGMAIILGGMIILFLMGICIYFSKNSSCCNNYIKNIKQHSVVPAHIP